MTLPKELGDREYQKFEEDENGDVSIRIQPGAVRDSTGNELAIDSTGKAQTFDLQALTQLKDISEKLETVILQLQFITGVDSLE